LPSPNELETLIDRSDDAILSAYDKFGVYALQKYRLVRSEKDLVKLKGGSRYYTDLLLVGVSMGSLTEFGNKKQVDTAMANTQGLSSISTERFM
jgi:hypothetical protein